MSRDPLARLLRLRHRAVEQARLAVVAAVHQEVEAAAAIRRIDDDAEHDRHAAAELDRADPPLGPQFGPRLGYVLAARRERLRAERAAAAARLAEAEAATAARRAELAAARTEAEAVEILITSRQAAVAAAAERRAAHELDDVFRTQLLRRRAASGQH